MKVKIGDIVIEDRDPPSAQDLDPALGVIKFNSAAPGAGGFALPANSTVKTIRGTVRVLTTVLLFAASSAWAEWVKVTETVDTAFYVDRASLGDKSNVRRVAVLQDYAKQEPGGVRSRRVSYEIDCTAERLRSLSVTEHSEPMAGGTSVNSWARESEWMYVAPRTGSNLSSRSTYRTILRFVCAG